MTLYERLRLLAIPILPAIYDRVHRDLHPLVKTSGKSGSPPALLDVGGRTSPYTIGMKAQVTVLDLPRESDVQTQLHLGISDQVLHRLKERRSNIEQVVLEDMTRCSLADQQFAGVIAVEVIEHVPDDDAFCAQIARVLKSNGWAYLTTPNGDYIKNEPPNYNPDHLRHYTREEFASLLARHFRKVEIVYAIRTGKWRVRGLKSMSARRPLRTLQTMFANWVSRRQSQGLQERAQGTAHLIAIVRK